MAYVAARLPADNALLREQWSWSKALSALASGGCRKQGHLARGHTAVSDDVMAMAVPLAT